ncbi:hypothetical protein [Streptomyces sp. NPDC002082]|uniref:hypothetical protein n=1 Tax=Streptomyces sp. NPDC002082 TaxID=3154772 RepID=UPI00331FFAEB
MIKNFMRRGLPALALSVLPLLATTAPATAARRPGHGHGRHPAGPGRGGVPVRGLRPHPP